MITDFLDFLRQVDAYPANPSCIKITNGEIKRYKQAHDRHKDNARYCLWDNGGWSNGWVINSKEGIRHNWVSSAKSNLTPSEKRKAELAIKRQQAEREKVLADRRTMAARALASIPQNA